MDLEWRRGGDGNVVIKKLLTPLHSQPTTLFPAPKSGLVRRKNLPIDGLEMNLEHGQLTRWK